MKHGKGQEAKEIGFLKLDTSASNRPAERPLIALFLGLENGQFLICQGGPGIIIAEK